MSLTGKIRQAKTEAERLNLAWFGCILSRLESTSLEFIALWGKSSGNREKEKQDILLDLCTEFLWTLLNGDSKALRQLAKRLDKWKGIAGSSEQKQRGILHPKDVWRTKLLIMKGICDDENIRPPTAREFADRIGLGKVDNLFPLRRAARDVGVKFSDDRRGRRKKGAPEERSRPSIRC